jgi:hypothetical protein
MTPSRFSLLGHPREVGTTTNGGVLRLLASLEFSEDRCIGRSVAVNANTRDHERDNASTDICCNTSEWRVHPPLGRVLAHSRYPSRHPRCGRRIRAAGQYHRYPGRPSRCRQAGRTHSTCLSRTQFRLWRRRPRQKSMTAPVRISTAVFACSARRRSGHRFCSERRPRRISFGSSRLTPNRCNVKELLCVCAFRFIARAVRRHDTHHPRFVPVQDRSDARRQIAWPRSALAAGRRAAARLPALADPADARAHVVLVVHTLHGAPRRRDVRPGDSPTKSTRSAGHRSLSQPSRAARRRPARGGLASPN